MPRRNAARADQVSPKRCGHFSGKSIVRAEEMIATLRAAVTARSDPDLVLIARTDALAIEGVDATVDGARRSAGLPERYQFFYRNEPWRRPSPDETVRRCGALLSPPGERFEYSNLGYGLLSTMISRVSGVPFAEYMRTSVFLPLRMTRNSVDVDPTLSHFQAIRYGVDGLPIPPAPTCGASRRRTGSIRPSATSLARIASRPTRSSWRSRWSSGSSRSSQLMGRGLPARCSRS